MKKPKPRVGRSYKIPKDALIVNYGLKRGVLPYKHPLDVYNNKEIDVISKWCEKTFPTDSWRINRAAWPGYIYFLEERYVTMFTLKWAK